MKAKRRCPSVLLDCLGQFYIIWVRQCGNQHKQHILRHVRASFRACRRTVTQLPFRCQHPFPCSVSEICPATVVQCKRGCRLRHARQLRHILQRNVLHAFSPFTHFLRTHPPNLRLYMRRRFPPRLIYVRSACRKSTPQRPTPHLHTKPKTQHSTPTGC